MTIDGHLIGTVSLHSAIVTSRRIVFARTLGQGSHTLVIRNLGTSGHSRIDLDAILTTEVVP